MELAPDIVKPVEMLLPILKRGGMPGWMIRCGLYLYDALAAKAKIHRHRWLGLDELADKAPILNNDLFSKCYAFWDAQTDDLALVHRVDASARKLGADTFEGWEVETLRQSADGWQVRLRNEAGNVEEMSALYVVNCAGPWAHEILARSNIRPKYEAINNKGSHIIVADRGLRSGLFLQSPDDGRIFFMLPWCGSTLIGTTEELYRGDLNQVDASDKEVEYLLERCNRYLTEPLRSRDVIDTFAGLRWLATDGRKGLTETSRSYLLSEHAAPRGLLITLYGGKLTTYRALSAEIGDRITSHFGEFQPSKTASRESWCDSQFAADIATRFSI
jgi:glycerol-3-phosphate dehydrogenase